MNRRTGAKPGARGKLVSSLAVLAVLALSGAMGPVEATPVAETSTTAPAATSRSKRQAAIPPIAAFMAIGDMPRLRSALNAGLDAGLTVSETREVLVHLYAYTGFPRSLNALNTLMKVLDGVAARRTREALAAQSPRKLTKSDTGFMSRIDKFMRFAPAYQ